MFRNKLPLLILLASFLSGCTPTTSSQSSGTSSVEPVTPVYQGMEISSSGAALGKKNGSPIDQDNPFGNPIGQRIEDYIATDMPIINPEALAYYAVIDEEVIVTVNVFNPTAYEILSFTLNAYKYQSYQFEEGSDSEHLLLKTSVGATPGIKEYTIDQIKYVDGVDIKDVIIEGNQTVEVGIRYPGEPSITVSNIVTDQLSYAFDIDIIDPDLVLDNVGSELRAYLFDGVALIDQIILTSEWTEVLFSTLKPNTLYQYALVGIYDNLSGEGPQRVYFHKEAFYTNAYVTIIDVEPTKSSVTFSVTEDDPSEVGSVTAIELYKGETLIESLVNLSVREFTNLLSYNEYIIRITFTYNLNDGNGEVTSIANYSFMTTAKTIPTVEIQNVVSTQTSVNFGIAITDPDSVGALTAIHLMQGQDIIASLMDMNEREFVDLMSDSTYLIRVTYTYDLNDGLGDQTVVSDYEFITLAKVIPMLTVVDVVPTQTSIAFGISFDDPDQVCDLTAIELYHDDSLVSALADVNLREFTGLTVNTGYSLRITYAYNLNDGLGVQEQTIMENVATLAHEITITEITVLNTTSPQVGEQVHVRIYFTNPDAILINAFIINGQEVSVAGGTITTTSAIVHFVPEFEGGLYEVLIDAIRYASNGVELQQNISSAFSDSIIILGELNVVGIALFDGRDYISIADVASEYLLLEIANPTGYNISQLKINYHGTLYTYPQGEITMPDANHVKVLWQGADFAESYYNIELITVTSITYGISGGDYSTKLLSGVTEKIRLLKSDDVNLISTPSELETLQSGYVNRLVNDIDLVSTPWTPITSFWGILDGNGHTISNMSLIIENTSTEAQYIGLFAQMDGVVENLMFTSTYLFVETLGPTYVGTVVGIGLNNSVIDNVHVSGTTLSVESTMTNVGVIAGTMSGHMSQSEAVNASMLVATSNNTQVGGLVGSSGEYIESCAVTGFLLTATAPSIAIGGIAGYDDHIISHAAVEDITLMATATEDVLYAGGIVGAGRGINTCSVKHAEITVTGAKSMLVAGIAGISNVDLQISDCLVSDLALNVTNPSDSYVTQVCGIVASSGVISRCLVLGATFTVTAGADLAVIQGICIMGVQSMISNSYIGYDVTATYNDVQVVFEDEVVVLEPLNDPAFYIAYLSWSDTVWDLTNLNYENGLVPILIFEV